MIYQKMLGKYFIFVCLHHKREATYICINTDIKVVCDPKLGGIAIPCNCEVLSNGR